MIKDKKEYPGRIPLRIPKELHKDIAEKAKENETSVNQYCVYLLAKALYSEENK